MGQISESYASPGLRLGLLLEDHPQATYDFRLATGDEVGVPDEYGGGSKKFCVATIHFGDGRSISAWKPVSGNGTPDEWNILCTKTLGRALKRAGYPDDLKDLKALVLWRQRDAEIAAIRAGTAKQLDVPKANVIAALPSADPMQQALDEAGVSDGELVSEDDGSGDVAEVDGVLAERMEMVTELEAGLSEKDWKVYSAFCEQIGWPYAGVDGAPTPSHDQIEQLLGWFGI